MSYELTAAEAQALREISASLGLGRTLAELTSTFARGLAPLVEFASLSARVPGEPTVSVDPAGAPLAALPEGSTTRVFVERPVPGGGELGLTVRRRRRDPFSGRDVLILDLAAPGFAWAVSGRSIAAEGARHNVADEGGLLPAFGTLLLDEDALLRGSDGAGARLARACCAPGAPAEIPGVLEAAVKEHAAMPTGEWTRELTLPLRAGGLVRVRLARVGGRRMSVVAFLSVMPGSGAPVESEAILAGLTRREREVAELAARGMSNSEVARELGISAETVKQHLTQVFKKAGVDGRAALAARLYAGPAS